ncbi:nucleoside-diphosphate kinase [Gudongella sp. DL1XJH-153]|uniref:nucleoside-diphosphate kinase n=1 Tax=Gudongella sp. DL1XJH-153 TaxID=3409804 RepID=UPI003BB77D5B
MEKTFVMIKPDGVKRKLVGEVLKRIEAKGLSIEKISMTSPDRRILVEHYREHEGKSFYNDLIEFVSSGRVVLLQVGGEGSIKIMRSLIGDTDPVCASPGTIRGDFANSKTENIVHASDSESSATRELKLWFGDD